MAKYLIFILAKLTLQSDPFNFSLTHYLSIQNIPSQLIIHCYVISHTPFLTPLIPPSPGVFVNNFMLKESLNRTPIQKVFIILIHSLYKPLFYHFTVPKPSVHFSLQLLPFFLFQTSSDTNLHNSKTASPLFSPSICHI